MDVREKLIEILEEPCGGLYKACELADYLLDNGVTVQKLDGCDFCQKFDFAGARAEVNKYGAHISLAICNTKSPNDEQFKFCPMCGRRLSQPLHMNGDNVQTVLNGRLNGSNSQRNKKL